MPCLQPEIVVVDCLHQDGSYSTAVGAQSVSKYLIAHQRCPGCGDLILAKALTNALGEGLLCMGDAVHTVVTAEYLHTILVAVGHHTHRNTGNQDILDPGIHFLRCHACGIGYDGIIKVQHQQFDALLLKEFGSQVSKFLRDECRKQRKAHK